MNIKYYKGDDHELRFKIKNFTRVFDEVIFVVKDTYGSVLIEKSLGKGIEYKNGWYHVVLLPDDTSSLSTKNMTYDIIVKTNELTFTVNRGNFKIE